SRGRCARRGPVGPPLEPAAAAGTTARKRHHEGTRGGVLAADPRPGAGTVSGSGRRGCGARCGRPRRVSGQGMTRIVAGAARGRRLRVPRGGAIRPTTDRVREALFSSVESEVGALAGLRVLDLYAGS